MIQFLIISDSSQLLLNKCKKTGVVKQKSKKYIFVHAKRLTNYFCGPFTRTQPRLIRIIFHHEDGGAWWIPLSLLNSTYLVD